MGTNKQVNAVKNNAIKEAKLAQNKAIERVQQQARAVGLKINVRNALNTLVAKNEANVKSIAADYQKKAQDKQTELASQYQKEINQAKKLTFKGLQNRLNTIAATSIEEV